MKPAADVPKLCRDHEINLPAHGVDLGAVERLRHLESSGATEAHLKSRIPNTCSSF